MDDCYCAILSDAHRAELGLAPGHCGRCDVCGAPGHMRPDPRSRVATGAWCDAHYPGLSRRGELAVTWTVRLALGGLGLWWLLR